jgi:hypothetical protein
VTDLDLDTELSRVSGLNEIQIAGLAKLGKMDAQRIAEFQQRVDTAWQSNIDAVQDAKLRVLAAQRERAQIEVECGNAARARHSTRPVLNSDEVARVREAERKVVKAREAVAAAEATFKAGVTAEQIEAVN